MESGNPADPESQNESFIDSVDRPSPAETSPQAFTHFETALTETYKLPLDLQGAVLGDSESVASWLGPVNIGQAPANMSGNSFLFTTREVDKDAINTLLFTDRQIIGLMLGPADRQYLAGSGPLTTAGNEVIERWQWNREGAIAKGVQFAPLNSKHWGDMVDALAAQSLASVLGSHLNFGLPYDRVQRVEVRSRFINPGVRIYLTDGSNLRFLTFGKRDRLPQAASYLRQFVTVK